MNDTNIKLDAKVVHSDLQTPSNRVHSPNAVKHNVYCCLQTNTTINQQYSFTGLLVNTQQALTQVTSSFSEPLRKSESGLLWDRTAILKPNLQ